MDWITRTDDLANLTQGSIVDGIDWGQEDNPVSIVLSNACDIEHSHTSYLLVAALYPASDLIFSSREFLGETKNKKISQLTSGEKKAVKKLLSNYIHHKTINRYYFIDCRDSDLGMYMMVDFHHIQSVPIGYKDNLTLIANLNSPLKEQMMIQYISHTGRIPTDRVNSEEENLIIDELLSELE